MTRAHLRFHIFVCVFAIVVVTPVFAQVVETPLQCNGDLDATIAYGNIIQCSSSTLGDFDNISFQGTAGETIIVAIQRLSGDGSPLFRILAPDGTLLADWYILSRITLAQTGLHNILVAESSGDQLVDYTVTLERIISPSPTALPIEYGQPVNERLGPLADLDPFFFSATAGDTVNVTATGILGDGSPVFQIFAPDGTLVSDFTSSTQVALTQTGSHTILVAESFLDQTVDYSIILQCISGVCSSTTPPPPQGNGIPVITKVNFPSAIAGDGQEVYGTVQFTDNNAGVNWAQFDVLEDTCGGCFTPFSFDPNSFDPEISGLVEGEFEFFMHCTTEEGFSWTMRLTLKDLEGHVSEPVNFSIACEPPPIARSFNTEFEIQKQGGSGR